VIRQLLTLIVLILALPSQGLAQEQATAETGRFTFSPVPEGQLRLDTRTGEVSLCHRRAGSYVCEAVADDRAAYEREIARLKETIAALEASGKRDAKPGLQVPSDADIDRAVSMIERFFRRFMGVIEDLKREAESKRS
jgi:hypothetical protein